MHSQKPPIFDFWPLKLWKKIFSKVFFTNKMAAISQKNIFIKVKNSFIRLYLNKLLDSENGTKNKKASRGSNFWNEVRSLDGYILGMVNSLKLKFSGFSFHRVWITTTKFQGNL